MKGSRLEDVLDECLSAYLEGRRSVEESLELYRDLREELEPLLRTAVVTFKTFHDGDFLEHAPQQALDRFLAAASQRRSLKSLSHGLGRLSPAPPRLLPRPLPAAIGVTFAVAAAVLVAVFALRPSSDGQESTTPGSAAAHVPPAVTELRQTHAQLRQQASTGAVRRSLWRDLTATTTELATEVRDLSAVDTSTRRDARDAIADQVTLLREMVHDEGVPSEAFEALDATEALAARWGVAVPLEADGTPASPTPTAEPTRAPTASPSPQPSASPETSASPTPLPSSVP